MSDKGNADAKNEDIWSDSHMDLDTRNLIDVQVAMADPSAKKIRGQGFSQTDRNKVKAHMKRIIEQHIIPST